MPEYSREADEDTLVPAGIRLYLAKGKNNLRVDTRTLTIPNWWRTEHNAPHVQFFQNDIRWLELCAEIDEDAGPVDDTLKIDEVNILAPPM